MAKAKFTNVDRDKDTKIDHFLGEFTYDGESGSANLDQISISLNEEGIPLNKVRLKIGEGNFQPLEQGIFASANYGETVTLEIAKDGGLSKGKHLLNIRCDAGYTPLSFALEGTV